MENNLGRIYMNLKYGTSGSIDIEPGDAVRITLLTLRQHQGIFLRAELDNLVPVAEFLINSQKKRYGLSHIFRLSKLL